MRQRNLLWGESPWDKMTREELLREVQKGYAAVESAWGVLAMLREGNEENPFWGDRGTGGGALARCEKVIGPVKQGFTSESIFHSFFRYANPLLFDEPNRWAICPICGQMLMGLVGEDTKSMIGKPCVKVMPFSSSNCSGVMKWFGWEDFERKDMRDGG